jgi:hypothetical protein
MLALLIEGRDDYHAQYSTRLICDSLLASESCPGSAGTGYGQNTLCLHDLHLQTRKSVWEIDPVGKKLGMQIESATWNSRLVDA